MEYAVDVLKVRHVLIVGHYGCGVMKAILSKYRLGLVDNWLRHIQDVVVKYRHHLEALQLSDRPDRLCELNVIEQVVNACESTLIQEVWARGQPVTVHGMMFSVSTGLLQPLNISISENAQLDHAVSQAVKNLSQFSSIRSQYQYKYM